MTLSSLTSISYIESSAFSVQAVTLALSYFVHFLVLTSYLNPEYTQVLTFVFISHFKPKVDLIDLNISLVFWVFISW